MLIEIFYLLLSLIVLLPLNDQPYNHILQDFTVATMIVISILIFIDRIMDQQKITNTNNSSSQHALSQHALSQHALSQHALSQHALSQHALSQHALSQHALSQHALSQYALSQYESDSESESEYDDMYDDGNMHSDNTYDMDLKRYPKLIQSLIEKQMFNNLIKPRKSVSKICSICLENNRHIKIYYCPFNGKHPIDGKCFDKFVKGRYGLCFVCKETK